MVVFVLDHPGVEAGDGPFDGLPVAIDAPIAHAGRAGHRGTQAGDRQAALPAQDAVLGQQFDLGVDEHGVVEPGILRVVALALGRDAEDEQAQRHMHLRRGQPDAGRVLHGLHHVGDEPPDFRRTGIGNRVAAAQQHGVAHPGDLENGHGASDVGRKAGSARVSGML